MKTVIITGSQGFLGGYMCREFLNAGYKVVGYDDYSKYGYVKRDYDNHPNFTFFEFDLSADYPDFEAHKPDIIILAAALIGGISLFHQYAFDLIMQNELIMANCYKSILDLSKKPERVVTISSSMVYEGADMEFSKLDSLASMNCCGPNNFCVDPAKEVWPTRESQLEELPPPVSTYGGQKLMCEYWAKGAWEQYQIPYTIIRPFNAVGLGEEKSKFDCEMTSGDIKLLMSHVLPDLMNKALRGQKPLRILGDGSQSRCLTHGKDIARGIRAAVESEAGFNNAFNISTPRETTIMELAKLVWEKVNPGEPFQVAHDTPYEHDVRRRAPDVTKAKLLLGFKAEVTLEQSIDELYNHMKNQMQLEHVIFV